MSSLKLSKALLLIAAVSSCSLLAENNLGTTVPAVDNDPDPTAVTLGLKFQPTVNGYITHSRFYKGSGNTGTHIGYVYLATGGAPLATVTYTGETASGWQSMAFSPALAVTAGTRYMATLYFPNGRFSKTDGLFAGTTVSNGANLLRIGNNDTGGPNGVYGYGAPPQFPTGDAGGAAYFVDIEFSTTDPGGEPPPAPAKKKDVITLNFPRRGREDLPWAA